MGSMGIIAAIGTMVLVLVLIWAIMRNMRRSRSDVRRTEEATLSLHQQMDREDKISDPDPVVR